MGLLKDKIAKEVEIPRERVILRRGGVHGIEMKNDSALIKDCHLFNMASVFVEEGVPAAMEETRLSIFEAFYFDSPVDNCFYEFKRSFILGIVALWSGPLKTNVTVKEFKEQLSEKTGKDARLMRLRERNKDKLTKVYHDSKRMDFYKTYEGKQLAVQALKAPESPSENEFLVMVRMWDPHTWALSPLREFYVERSCTLPVFGALLCSVFDVPVSGE